MVILGILWAELAVMRPINRKGASPLPAGIDEAPGL